MAGMVASLQDQVNGLYNEMNHLRGQLLGQGAPAMQEPQPPQQPQQQSQTPIDPSLGNYSSQRPSLSGLHGSSDGQMVAGTPLSPNSQRLRRQSFRGPTSAEFNFGVAKSSLQTMGITSNNDGDDNASGGAGNGTADASPVGSPDARNRGQQLQTYHSDKDPIWQISQEEAIRLCRVYEDEMGLMYPVLDINVVIAYAGKLYRFMEAAHRAGLMQQGMPGADSIEDEDTNILKLVLAVALTVEGSGQSELGQSLFAFVQPAVDNSLMGNVGIKGIRLLTMAVCFRLWIYVNYADFSRPCSNFNAITKAPPGASLV